MNWNERRAAANKIAAQKRVAWTVAYWKRVKADPKLLEAHRAKVSAALRKRLEAGHFFRRKH